MIEGEIGNRIYLNAGVNVSTATNRILELRSSTTTKTITTGVHVGVVDVESPCGGTFAANHYFYYDTQDGDIDKSGRWSAWTEYDKPGGIHRVGQTAYFEVEKRG